MKVLSHHRMMKFGLVGGIGFIVDATVFAFCLCVLSMPLLGARTVAFICAASVTWLGNRCFTFHVSASGKEDTDYLKQWLVFIGCALISAIPNFILFQTVIFIFGDQEVMLFLALVSGVAVGMMSNYLLSCRFVFFSARA